MSANDYIAITFESSVTINTTPCQEILFFKATISSCSFSNLILKIVIPSSVSKFSMLIFEVGGFTNPGSSKPIAFKFKVYDSSDVLHSEASSNFELSAASQ